MTQCEEDEASAMFMEEERSIKREADEVEERQILQYEYKLMKQEEDDRRIRRLKEEAMSKA